MKHTLEEIKQMLSEISPWPWNMKYVYSHFFATEAGYRIKTPDGNLVAETGEGTHTIEEIRADAYFITSAPQIISDLVQDLEAAKIFLIRFLKVWDDLKIKRNLPSELIRNIMGLRSVLIDNDIEQ